MEQLDNRQTELFWELLANPADKSYTHVQNLRQLVSAFPQSSLLRSLLVYTGEDDSLGHAVAFTDPKLLYKLRNDATGLSPVNSDQLIATVSEKRYFHTNAGGHETETAIAPGNETEASQPTVDTEHFFKPEAEQGQAPEAPGQAIAEPEKLDDLLDYGDEVTTGEHELTPPVTEFHQLEHDVDQPEILQPGAGPEAPAVEEATPIAEHTHTARQEEQPAEAAAPEVPVIEQQIPLEETAPETRLEQEIELPTLGFYVPSLDNGDGEHYTGGDISSKLYESYTQTFEPEQQPAPQPIEDEVFDEIVGIDEIAVPNPFTLPKDEVPQSPQPVDEVDEPTLGFHVPQAAETSPEEALAIKSRRVDLNDEAEKLMLSNIAATDFFVFDQALSERIKSGDEPKETPAPSQPQPVAGPDPQNADAMQAAAKKVDYQRVTKYFDEKMPYSFMWWLDKTRKEHSGIYQPYVDFKLDTSQKIEKDVPDELQQQYYENIFNLTSVDELERATGNEPVKFDSKKKEDEIIERFIHEAPQIKPQAGEKLDNENKAKRSSEDQDEIVTETLAHVYADQMLYHKAIKVYEKLMLKFPEKRRYFAGQIEQLEKKIS